MRKKKSFPIAPPTHFVQETLSDVDDDFNPDLPTEFGNIDPAKDVVVEKENTEIDDGKSEKKAPVLVKKESTESAKVSQPPATPKIIKLKHRMSKKKLRFIFMMKSFILILVAKPW